MEASGVDADALLQEPGGVDATVLLRRGTSLVDHLLQKEDAACHREMRDRSPVPGEERRWQGTVPHTAAIAILILGFFFVLPDYFRWFQDLETLARSRSRWVLRRPWMWVPVLLEFGIGKVVNRLGEGRRRQDDPSSPVG